MEALLLPEEADERVRRALSTLEMNPEGPPGSISAVVKRALMKNRWAATANPTISRAPDGSIVVCANDMLGNKHFEILSDIAEAVGDEFFDDRGVSAAVERLGKSGRLFGRKEIRHLRNLIRASEFVVALGQGRWGSKMGLIVLTNERLFFFEKSLGSETLDEYDLTAISSLSAGKKLGGKTLEVHVSGNSAQITAMMPGQSDALARAFRTLKTERAAQPQAATSAPVGDPIAQLERLAGLRDKGILSDAEFEVKKAEQEC